MVFDFRLPDARLFEAMRVMGAPRRDAPGPLRGPGPARRGRRRRACSVVTSHRATTLRRDHRYVEAVATARALAFARQADAPVHVVHLSSAAALDEVRRAKAAGVRVDGRDLPALPGPDRGALRRARPRLVRPLRHLAAAPLRGRPRRAVGGPGRRVARPRRDGPRPRPPRRREGRGRARASPFNEISNGAPGIETLLDDPLLAKASPRAGSRSSGWSTCSRRPRRAGSAWRPRARIEVGRDADIVLFDPAARRTIRAADLHHTSDYTPYEGLEVAGAVRTSSSGRRSSRRGLRRPARRRGVRRASARDRRLTLVTERYVD